VRRRRGEWDDCAGPAAPPELTLVCQARVYLAEALSRRGQWANPISSCRRLLLQTDHPLAHARQERCAAGACGRTRSASR
jgi:hypothetical protein